MGGEVDRFAFFLMPAIDPKQTLINGFLAQILTHNLDQVFEGRLTPAK